MCRVYEPQRVAEKICTMQARTFQRKKSDEHFVPSYSITSIKFEFGHSILLKERGRDDTISPYRSVVAKVSSSI
ncbi:hypothetical protein DFA_03481 [Cavenderia fasciculata]|uniref:Uncharacterized protein n=1 Tax=Cavenderia fasciculata TaxID=261658 RepID=F4PHP9_CACFS|nr:uncharacterized protein DFA_03481 [Cavenderia fasciculata]EGG25233.1 hypothetical protein DFA_03481 [Cavenderia fasciculata]|eukprot:XP_004363084.1 hypothetical protein DFA_03481 [Cavenderia fasciculata]